VLQSLFFSTIDVEEEGEGGKEKKGKRKGKEEAGGLVGSGHSRLCPTAIVSEDGLRGRKKGRRGKEKRGKKEKIRHDMAGFSS